MGKHVFLGLGMFLARCVRMSRHGASRASTGLILQLTRIAVALGFATMTAAPSAADLRLDRSRSIQMLDQDGNVGHSEQRTEVVFIGESSARVDFGSESAIVRLADGVYLWLDHEAEAYAEVALPLKLEDLLTLEEQECLRRFPQALENVEAAVTLTGERRMIDQRETRRLKVEGRHFSGFQIESDSWVTDSLSMDLGPYHQLVKSRAALSTASRGWIGEVIAVGGYSVESTATRRMRGRVRHVVKQRLETVNEVDTEETRYQAPAGYTHSLSRPPLDIGCLRSE